VKAAIELGTGAAGQAVGLDMEELLATRLLVQGNSGSGKSHLLRRILEESAGMVQQVVIDPEGDFATLADSFGHTVVDGGAHSPAELIRLAGLVREHRASVVLVLDTLEIEAQMRCAAIFLGALFDAPREHWYPALVIVDEAQMFAPAVAGEVSDEARRLSLSAMTNLMCRGRKRGLAGIVATQRLAKLAKNVAAEASNFLMGRTFLDIDMARAADLLGMERRSAEEIRDLDRGQFLGLGPAISRRPIAVTIGPVRSGSLTVSRALEPPPSGSAEQLQALMKLPMPVPAPVAPPRGSTPQDAPQGSGHPPRTAADLEMALSAPPARDRAAASDLAQEAAGPVQQAILQEMAAEDGATFRPTASLFQDFCMRSRIAGASVRGVDLASFRRRFAIALAGLDEEDPTLAEVVDAAEDVPDDVLAPYLLLALAAHRGEATPDDEALGRVYGTTSPGRIRRLLDHCEKLGLIVVRTDFSGQRAISVTRLGKTTV
jgi:hypothetical protein